MKRIHVRHKISPGEIHNISDKESLVLIKSDAIKLEELIEVYAENGVFLSKIVFIDTATVEFEVLEKRKEAQVDSKNLTILQPILRQKRMTYAIEKVGEIGYDNMVPIISHYTKVRPSDAMRMISYWDKIARESQKQSLRPEPIQIASPIPLDQYRPNKNSKHRLCLVAENVHTQSLNSYIKQEKPKKNASFIVAVGPPEGWHFNELEYFKRNQFKFVTLGDTIFRSETAGLVVGSIIKYYQGEL